MERNSLLFLWVLSVILSYTTTIVAGQRYQSYALKVLSDPAGCVAGEVCGTQPSVAAVYVSSGEIAYSFQGSMYVVLVSSPTGYGNLYIGSGCSVNNCGEEVVNTLATVNIVNGIAVFQNLFFNVAGSGYVLNFIGLTITQQPFAQILSGNVSVSTGSPYKLVFNQFVGNAFGGQPSRQSVIVGVADRGGNIISTVNEGIVVANLTTNPTNAELFPINGTSAPIIDGLSAFPDLYINEAAVGYQLTFSTSLEGIFPLTSLPFTVAIGNVSQLRFLNGTELSSSWKYGGEYFAIPPIILLYDSGGNFVASDSSSAVRVSIYDNPSAGAILPTSNLFVTARRGMVRFHALKIDRFGLNYTLQFDLFGFVASSSTFFRTPVKLISEKFHIRRGPPKKIVLTHKAGGSWAGNQGFYNQPTLTLTDKGDNMLVEDFNSFATMSLTSSLAVSKQIAIDTRHAPQTKFDRITINKLNGTYYGGELIVITLHCKYLMYSNLTNSSGVAADIPSSLRPYLQLSVISLTKNNVTRNAALSTSLFPTRSLQFEYTVEEGDYIDSLQQSLLRKDSLHLQNSSLLDGNFQEIDLSLPVLTINASISINTSPAIVLTLSANVTNGVYRPGDMIDFVVTFSQPVIVEGLPYLLFSVNNVSNQSTDRAIYDFNLSVADADPNRIHFLYSVSENINGLLKLELPQILCPNYSMNSSYAAYYNMSEMYGFRYKSLSSGWIRAKSSWPVTPANYTISQHVLQVFYNNHQIDINSTTPSIDLNFGLQTNHAPGIVYPGEYVWLYLRYSSPVVAEGLALELLLSVGQLSIASVTPTGQAHFIRLLTDNQTLEFLYVVEENTVSSALTIVTGGHSLKITANDTFLRTRANRPLQNVNLKTSGLDESLPSRTVLTLVSQTSSVTSVTIVSTNPPGALTLYPDDILTIAVSFTTPVVSTCSPVLVLNFPPFYREAKYVSGNQSETFLFEYTILIGDSSVNNISYRSHPNALCAVSHCPLRTTCQIYTNATIPTLPANLLLEETQSIIGNQTVAPETSLRDTSITEVQVREEAGEYGVGSVFHFDVTFSDIVMLTKSCFIHHQLPSLNLNVPHRSARYYRGGNSPTLTFVYITQGNDSLMSTDLAFQLLDGQSTAIEIFPTCQIVNQIGVSANLTMKTPHLMTSSGIRIDPTPPNITSCIIETAKNFNYSAGSFLQIVLHVSKPVIVGGLLPRVTLLFALPGPVDALYAPSVSNSKLLVFLYRIQVDDKFSNFTIQNNEINLLHGLSQILRNSSIPTTPINGSIPKPIVRIEFPSDQIAVDLTSRIVAVRTLNQTGNYTAGDRLYFEVIFSEYVVAMGFSYLQLDVGGISPGNDVTNASFVAYRSRDEGNSWIIPDYLTPSNQTKALLYEYSVQVNDMSLALDYVDCTSLIIGFTAIQSVGYIKTYPDQGGMDADLNLPVPGSIDSIAGSTILRIDGRRPFLRSLSFLNDAGVYSINSTIWIAAVFSVPVVVKDSPSILLETGRVKQIASYISGSGTNILIFAYEPEPGDFNQFLDYYASREDLLSAAGSFNYQNDSILRLSQHPVAPAQIWLNPPSGNLSGTTTVISDGGMFEFMNVSLSKRGPDYLVFYEVYPVGEYFSLVLSQFLDCSFSGEYQLRPAAALQGEMIGASVDIEGDLAVIGAPNFNSSVTTVQVVTISVASGLPTREVQLISTSIQPQPSIQSFYTTAAVGGTVGGYFEIIVPGIGSSRPIPASVDAGTLQNLIQFDLPTVGSVIVSAQPYLYCACFNAFTWTITFTGQTVGTFDAIELSGDLLSGSDASISSATIIQNPSRLSGTFTLSAEGGTSPPIPYDADVASITSAIESLGLSVYAVSISMATVTTLVRTWSITFGAYHESYEIPLMQADASGLSGGLNPSVFVQISLPGLHGPLGIAGYFQLSFRGNITRPLSPNVTALEMKTALEALPTINYVNVNRTLATPDIGAYSWTIEFVSINYHTSRGYFEEYHQANADALVPSNFLIATDPNIEIDAKWSFGGRNMVDSAARQGTFGAGAGAAFIYQRFNESWVELTTLRGNDTVENNRFGTAVAIDADTILIGAVGANMDGKPEKQAIHCNANNGTFSLYFRGWTTSPISYNISQEGFVEAIISPSSVFSNLYSITAVTIDGWGPGGLCANNTAVITFYRPVDGAINIFGVDTGPALELLQVTNNYLSVDEEPSLAKISVYEVQEGTWRVHGIDSDPQQIGAAYVFRLQRTCNSSDELIQCWNSVWKQEQQFFPLLSRQFSNFGQSVELDEGVAIVSAPGSDLESGYVYVYEYDSSTTSWTLLQLLTDPAISTNSFFGQAISKSGNTIVISSPGYLNSSGSAYAYTRPASGGVFVFSQTLSPPNIYSIGEYSYYGQSVGISGNLVAVSAPGYDDESIFLGSLPSTSPYTNSGGVFIFTRPTVDGLFTFLQKLIPTNVHDYDQFGYQLKIDMETVLISSMPSSTSEYISSKAVIDIETSAAYGHTPLGGYFKLSWRGQNDSTGSIPSLYTTRPIRYDISATGLKYILEQDLHTEKLLVNRSNVDLYDGGYAWSVTFLRYRGAVDVFLTDNSVLTGTNATVIATIRVPSPQKLRNSVHVFQYNQSASIFTEQLYLSPYRYQGNDICGSAVSISGSYAIVGCPNRDLDVSGYNSGAAMIYDLNLLSLQYSTTNTTVTEGETAEVSVVRDATYPGSSEGRDVLFYQQTLDRNANISVQLFFVDHYGLHAEASVNSLETILDDIGIVGKAVARAQFYGSATARTSRWVDGRYDYRAIADYAQVLQPRILLSEQIQTGISVETNNDSIVEIPREAVSVAVSVPGIWPSILGKFYHPINLNDFSTGIVRNKERYGEILLSSNDLLHGETAGSAVAFEYDYGVIFIGAPLAEISSIPNAGRVIQYNRNNFTWETSSPASTFSSSFLSSQSIGGNFGASLALSVTKKLYRAILVIGEPLNNRVFIYSADGNSFNKRQFHEEKVFTVNETTVQSNMFGFAVAISNNVLVIGAPGLEAIFVSFNYFSETETVWKWTNPTAVHSSDYDFDVIDGVIQPHRQGFGTSVSASGRTIVAGAPYANYDKYGTYLVENYDTEGIDILAVGKGKVYAFYSQPNEIEICVNARQILSTGSFRLIYTNFGIVAESEPILFNASAATLQSALSKLANTEELIVTAHQDYFGSNQTAYQYCWNVAFYSDWVALNSSTIKAEWSHGCINCTTFDYPSPSSSLPEVTISSLQSVQQFSEVAGLNAFDGRQGDRFGASVSINGNYIVSGAPYSGAVTSTTWDFEAGKLFGWSKSGNAFDYQPTYGDNSKYRASDGSTTLASSIFDKSQFRSSSSNMKGLYYVSTFECRPGSDENYLIPNPNFPAGFSQGNEPTGTLSSDVFMILGNTISFYIGGGCDIFSVYVELLVDGKSVAKQTGKCSETMELVSFDVSKVKNRAGQLRIVDNSTSIWGYISVDNVVFDWSVLGATRAVGSNLAVVNGGNVESPLSGSAYVFHRRQVNGSSIACKRGNELACVWEFETKLLPSDKRSQSNFGAKVAVSDENGIIVVSAPSSPLMQNYKDTPTLFPYVTKRGFSDASALDFPLSPFLMTEFQSFPYYTLQSSGAYAVWEEMNETQIFPNLMPSSNVGAVYVFTKSFPAVGYTGEFAQNESWKNTEKAKIQPIVDGRSGDLFGQSLAFDGEMLLIGAPGHHAVSESLTGAAYFYRTEFAAIRFSQITFAVLEGAEFVTLTVFRDISIFSGEVVIEYATSDLTGKGVDTQFFDYCLSLPVQARGSIGCGDYEQTVGYLIIPAGLPSGGFTVRIMDDRCYFSYMKYVQVTVAVPGSGALQGEDIETMIRIDDNDFDNQSGPFAASACPDRSVPRVKSSTDYIP